MYKSNIDRDPDYLRDRIEGTHDMGRKYLISIALCAGLIATTAIERQWFDTLTVSPSFAADNLDKSLPKTALREICFKPVQSWHGMKKLRGTQGRDI
jgi:hypothetical protein